MAKVKVKTKEQLKAAKEKGEKEIIVVGDLAKQLRIAKKVTVLGPVALGVITTALAIGVPTGGLSMAMAAPIAAKAGVDASVIIAVSFIGVSLVIALYKDYETIEFSMAPPKMVLKKKK